LQSVSLSRTTSVRTLAPLGACGAAVREDLLMLRIDADSGDSGKAPQLIAAGNTPRI